MNSVLFVTDPLAGLQADIDATIGLMSATQDLGLDVWCCGPEELAVVDGRLRARAQDPEEVVRRRMAKAADEMSHWAEYDYIVVNHEIATTVAEVKAILAAERLRRERQIGLAEFVKAISSA